MRPYRDASGRLAGEIGENGPVGLTVEGGAMLTMNELVRASLPGPLPFGFHGDVPEV